MGIGNFSKTAARKRKQSGASGRRVAEKDGRGGAHLKVSLLKAMKALAATRMVRDAIENSGKAVNLKTRNVKWGKDEKTR
jgi:hypothetical protein